MFKFWKIIETFILNISNNSFQWLSSVSVNYRDLQERSPRTHHSFPKKSYMNYLFLQEIIHLLWPHKTVLYVRGYFVIHPFNSHLLCIFCVDHYLFCLEFSFYMKFLENKTLHKEGC